MQLLKAISLKNGFTKVNDQVKTLGQSLKKNVGMTLKMMGSMLIMSVVFGTINKAMSSALESNKQLNAKVDYLYYALGQALMPVIEWIVNSAFQLMGYIGAAAKLLTGTNPFANSLSKYMAKTSKSTKEIKNNLADIDEIHNITEDTGTDSNPNIDLSGFDLASQVDLNIGTFKNKITELKNFGTKSFDSVISYCNQDFVPKYGKVFGTMANVAMPYLGEIYGGGKTCFEGLIMSLEGISTGDWPKVWQGMKISAGAVMSTLWLVITAPFEIAFRLIETGFDNIWKLWSKMWSKIPKIKMPHFKVDWETDGSKAEIMKKIGLPGWPRMGVDWYAKGGGFGGPNVIGVGEYVGAKSNPEVVAPQNMIYEMSVKANQDTGHSTKNEVINFVNELKLNSKVLAREIIEDLSDEATRRGYKPLLQK